MENISRLEVVLYWPLLINNLGLSIIATILVLLVLILVYILEKPIRKIYEGIDQPN